MTWYGLTGENNDFCLILFLAWSPAQTGAVAILGYASLKSQVQLVAPGSRTPVQRLRQSLEIDREATTLSRSPSPTPSASELRRH